MSQIVFWGLAAFCGIGCLVTTYMAGWYSGRNDYGSHVHASEAWGWFRLFGLLAILCVLLATYAGGER